MFLPIGHDQGFYGRSWLTWALMAANVIAFAIVALSSGSEEARVDAAAARLDRALMAYPDARVSPQQLRKLPDGVAELLMERTQASPDADGEQELGAALRDFSRAVEKVPAVRFGYRPGKPGVTSALTSLFVHGGLWHLLTNMLFLWLAGVVIECFWERRRFVLLYFGAGVAALIAHHLAQPESMTPVIGASGAIAGVMGAFLIGYPKTRISLLSLFGEIRVPVWVVVPLWALIELAHGLGGSEIGVAHWAHVGGFVFGAGAAIVAHRLNLVYVDGGSA
jgi:membrane associated rhomboid family serine protease